MEHDDPINVKYENKTQGNIYEADFETALAAQMFISQVKERQHLEIESVCGI